MTDGREDPRGGRGQVTPSLSVDATIDRMQSLFKNRIIVILTSVRAFELSLSLSLSLSVCVERWTPCIFMRSCIFMKALSWMIL